jgi:hypothetical protein
MPPVGFHLRARRVEPGTIVNLPADTSFRVNDHQFEIMDASVRRSTR